MEERGGRWWHSFNGPWIEIAVSGWAVAVGGPSPYPPFGADPISPAEPVARDEFMPMSEVPIDEE